MSPRHRVIRAAELVRKPWKNGGGTTADVAIHPEGGTLGAFDWRISMADVASDGPFSAFPGIDRTLVLTEGPGIVLTVDGVDVRLDQQAPSLRFRGEAETTGRLIASPIRDLNVMTRRDAYTHEVHLLDGESHVSVPEGTTVLVIVARLPGLSVMVADTTVEMNRLDCLLLDAPAPASRLPVSGAAVLVAIGPVD